MLRMPPPVTALDGSDVSVQATNDDAQVSKASCAKTGYFKDDFIHHFIRRPSRRSPLIHRGYYSRNAALKKILHQFLALKNSVHESAPLQILSLGAGFDTTWFQLQAQNVGPLRYVEVDFQEVTVRKVTIIKAKPELRSLVEQQGDAVMDVHQGRLTSPQYSVFPVDLRNLGTLEAALSSANFDMTAPSFVLSECVLVYMDPAASTALLEWLGSRLKNAACAIYEQINPFDAFGRQMVSNLESRGCPLKGLHQTPTLEAHEQRLLGCGWGRAHATDMDTIYKSHIDPEDKRRIERLEVFDEFEEWHMIQEHYCIAIGVNDEKGLFSSFGFKTAATVL